MMSYNVSRKNENRGPASLKSNDELFYLERDVESAKSKPGQGNWNASLIHILNDSTFDSCNAVVGCLSF